jgi:PhnB protein
MSYSDIFVIPVPRESIADYRKIAQLSATVWREHGALSYVEVQADDVKPGKWTSFPQSVDLKEGEIVVVALVTYRSRAHRDDVNAAVMQDPRMNGLDPKTMPFDTRRMFFGGFKPFVDEAHASQGAAIGKVQPYLFFHGRAEEAIQYYKLTLGAEVLMVMRFRDNPDKPGPECVTPGSEDKIMHAGIKIGETIVMLSDGMAAGRPEFKGMALSLSVSSEAEADRIFNALCEGGEVQMPIGKTFFSPRFGVVADKFGVSWMVGVHPEG